MGKALGSTGFLMKTLKRSRRQSAGSETISLVLLECYECVIPSKSHGKSWRFLFRKQTRLTVSLELLRGGAWCWRTMIG